MKGEGAGRREDQSTREEGGAGRRQEQGGGRVRAAGKREGQGGSAERRQEECYSGGHLSHACDDSHRQLTLSMLRIRFPRSFLTCK